MQNILNNYWMNNSGLIICLNRFKEREEYYVMADFDTQLNELLERTKNIKSPINVAPLGTSINEYNMPSEIWMNDVQIFYENYLKEHALGNRINSFLFHRRLGAYSNLVSCLESISKDKNFIDKMNGVQKVTVSKYQEKGNLQYDVFISHANRDKEDFVEELYQAINKLGINIFYDKDIIDWGDDWKNVILDGKKSQNLQ